MTRPSTDLPPRPHKRGTPLEFGELFTYEDYLAIVEQTDPEMPTDVARLYFDRAVASGVVEPYFPAYRFVPAEERLGYVVIVSPLRGN